MCEVIFVNLRSLFILFVCGYMFNSLLSLNSINFGMLCFMFYFYQDIQVSFWILVFDSTVDKWLEWRSVFNERIIGKKQLVFLIEDEDNEVFGYYLHTEIIEKYNEWNKGHNKSFYFNLQSNGRLSKPMKFEISNPFEGGYQLFKNGHVGSAENLIGLGDMWLGKQEFSDLSNCEQHENHFNFHGIQRALCGRQPNYEGEMLFDPQRIIVIQMN